MPGSTRDFGAEDRWRRKGLHAGRKRLGPHHDASDDGREKQSPEVIPVGDFAAYPRNQEADSTKAVSGRSATWSSHNTKRQDSAPLLPGCLESLSRRLPRRKAVRDRRPKRLCDACPPKRTLSLFTVGRRHEVSGRYSFSGIET